MKTTLSLLAASCLVVPLTAEQSGPGNDLINLFEKMHREGATDADLRKMLEESVASELQLPELKGQFQEPGTPDDLTPPQKGGTLDAQRQRLEEQLRDDMRSGTFHPAKWFIGLSVEPLDSFVREHLGLEKDSGVKVNQVAAGSPAARAGIQSNDIIFRAGGKKISSMEGLKLAVTQAGQDGKPLRLEWIHQGTRKDAEIMPEGIPGIREDRRSSGPNPSESSPPPQLAVPSPSEPEGGHFHGGKAFPGQDNEAERAWKMLGREMQPGERKEMAPAASPEEAPRWVIGVIVQPIDPMTRSHFELPDGIGVRVESVVRGGPAAGAGLKVNDLIVAANKQQIGSLDALKEVVEKAGSEGKPVHLEVIRRGSRDVVKVEPRDSKVVVEKPDVGDPAKKRRPMVEVDRRLDEQQRQIRKLNQQIEELREQMENMQKREER